MMDDERRRDMDDRRRTCQDLGRALVSNFRMMREGSVRIWSRIFDFCHCGLFLSLWIFRSMSMSINDCGRRPCMGIILSMIGVSYFEISEKSS